MRPLPPRTAMGRQRPGDRTMHSGFCGSSGPGWPDGMCPSDSDPGRACVPGRAAYPVPPVAADGRSTGCCGPPRHGRTPPGVSTGWCRLTPASSEAHQHAAGARKGAPQPGPRTLRRRPDQPVPPRLRRSGPPPARLAGHGSQRQRLRRGTLLRPLEAAARYRHSLRQDRRVLPGNRHPRIAPDRDGSTKGVPTPMRAWPKPSRSRGVCWRRSTALRAVLRWGEPGAFPVNGAHGGSIDEPHLPT